jgi:hypothetical protein
MYPPNTLSKESIEDYIQSDMLCRALRGFIRDKNLSMSQIITTINDSTLNTLDKVTAIALLHQIITLSQADLYISPAGQWIENRQESMAASIDLGPLALSFVRSSAPLTKAADFKYVIGLFKSVFMESLYHG